jgi:hypothetical protein
VNTVLGLIPFTKLLSITGKVVKGLYRAFKAYTAWKKAVKWADGVLAKADEIARAARQRPSCHSFHPETLVVMGDRTRKRIKDIRLADAVLATDPRTGRTQPRAVAALHRNYDTALTDIAVAITGGGSTILRTTQNHPFWNNTTHRWELARELQPGAELLAPDGTATRVSAVRNHTGGQVMYDLTVAELSTYFVVAGPAPVLVHNNSSTCAVHGGATSIPRRDQDGELVCSCDRRTEHAPIEEANRPTDVSDEVTEQRDRTEASQRVAGQFANHAEDSPMLAITVGAAVVFHWARRRLWP